MEPIVIFSAALVLYYTYGSLADAVEERRLRRGQKSSVRVGDAVSSGIRFRRAPDAPRPVGKGRINMLFLITGNRCVGKRALGGSGSKERCFGAGVL